MIMLTDFLCLNAPQAQQADFAGFHFLNHVQQGSGTQGYGWGVGQCPARKVHRLTP